MRARLTMTRLAVRAKLKAGKDAILGFQMARQEGDRDLVASTSSAEIQIPPAGKRSTVLRISARST